ncbi:MAG: glycosyltransferase family 2 protein [bacterium]
MSKVAVLIPAYNEEATIGVLLKTISEMLVKDYKILVVDDGSTDRTAEIAGKYAKVIGLGENLGVGAATKKGFECIADYMQCRYVVKLDGDGQHDPAYILKVVRELEKGADLVICSRFNPLSDVSNATQDRILLNYIFSSMVSRVTGWELTDVRSGFMGFCSEDIIRISDIITPRYGVPMELIIRLWNSKPLARVVEISHPAKYGGTRKLERKYEKETIEMKSRRFTEAYMALLNILQALNINLCDHAYFEEISIRSQLFSPFSIPCV